MAEYVSFFLGIVTDGSSSHVNLKDHFASHIAIVEKNAEEVVKKSLPWVHLIIGECRNGIAAIHKDIDKRFLQLYLSEYCWKFNRRFFRDSTDPKYDLFDRLIKIAATYTSDVGHTADDWVSKFLSQKSLKNSQEYTKA